MDQVILITEDQFPSSIQMGNMHTLFHIPLPFRRCLHMRYTKDTKSFALSRLLKSRILCRVLLEVGAGSACVYIRVISFDYNRHCTCKPKQTFSLYVAQ
jgi:hypothetical protein